MFSGVIDFLCFLVSIGRKKVLVIATFGLFCSAFGAAWAKSYAVYVVLRFFVTFFGIGLLLTSYVMGEN